MKSRVLFVWIVVGVLLAGGAALASIPVIDAVEVAAPGALPTDNTAIDDTATDDTATDDVVSETAGDESADTDAQSPGVLVPRANGVDMCFDYTGNMIPCLVTYCANLGEPVTVPADQVPDNVLRPGDIIDYIETIIYRADGGCNGIIDNACQLQGDSYVLVSGVPATEFFSAPPEQFAAPGTGITDGFLGPDCSLLPPGSITGFFTCDISDVAGTELALVQDMGNLTIAVATLNSTGYFSFVGLEPGLYGLVARSGSCDGSVAFGIEVTTGSPNVQFDFATD